MRRFDIFNEECVVSFEGEGDERLHMPLCGVTDCLPGYRITRRDSPEWVFECVTRGSGILRIDNKEFHPRAGDVYIARFGSSHEYASNDSDPWKKIWFNIRGSLPGELMRIYNLESLRHLPGCGLEGVFQECLDMMRANTDRAHETATLVTHRLIYNLARAAAGRGRKIPACAARMKKLLDGSVASGSRVSTAKLSRLCGKSPSQMNRIFAEFLGAPPYAYLMGRRLELAKVMLVNSSLSVKEISARAGFADPYHFSNIFKSKFGMSPKFFRENAPRAPSK